jgi:hypothetical protein
MRKTLCVLPWSPHAKPLISMALEVRGFAILGEFVMEFEIESGIEFVVKPKSKVSHAKVANPEDFDVQLENFYNTMGSQKYRKHYEKLVTRAKARKLKQYVEKHHIIPRCLGGINCPDNIVELTPEEHYVAHQFLTVAFPDNKKLVHAAKMMTTNKWGRRSNKLYGWLRQRLSEAMKNRVVSEETRAKNRAYGNSAEAKAHFDKLHAAQIGVPISDERKAKIAIKSKENGISAETRAKMVASRKANNYVMSEEQKENLRNIRLGTKHEPETLLKMSISQKARPPRSPETCAKIS